MKKKNGSVNFQDDDTGLFLTRIDGRHTFEADQGTYLCPLKFEESFRGTKCVKEIILHLRHTDHKVETLIDP